MADSNESLVGVKVSATLHTSKGDIRINLFPDHAPKTVSNFVGLAEGTKEYGPRNAKGGTSGPFYDGMIFHRVIDGFMIQTGDPTGTGRGGPGYEFGDELPQAGQYKIGSLAMANSGANTNGSQFFIISGDQGVTLPPQYSLFGQVTAGLDVVQKIDAVGAPNSEEGKPTAVVTMESVTIKEA